MSSDTLATGAAAPVGSPVPPPGTGGPPREAPARGPAKRRRRPPVVKPWFTRLHRWVSLAVGVVLLLACVSGAVLLMAPELMRVGHGDRYQHTASAQPLDSVGALELVREQRPELEPDRVRRFRGVWTVSGAAERGPEQTAFVDPGARAINDVAVMEQWVVRFLDNLHECALGCDDLPGYLPVMDKTVWREVAVRTLVLGSLGVFLALLCVSGFVIWWPSIRKLGTGFRVRRGRGSYVRDLDLHKVVGIIALPMLAMWGVSAMNFEFDWPAKAYYAAMPGSEPDRGEDPEPGDGDLLGIRDAQAVASALHPGARLVGVDVDEPEEEGGLYEFRFSEGFDVDKDNTSPGNVRVTVDSHGGGVRDRGAVGGPVTVRYWEDWQDGMHFGSFVPWIPRLGFVVWGLAPVLLGITGITIWLVKWRSRRNRAFRKRLERASADEPAAAASTAGDAAR